MQIPTSDQCKKFVEFSNPHSWLLVADSLHEQAIELHRHRNGSLLTRIDYRNGEHKSWPATNRSVFLLGGFALENAIKCFLVYENPHWISNGHLSKELRSHSLTALQKKSRHIPYKNRYVWVLQDFEDGLESWARHPCALSASTSQVPAIMNDKLWLVYLRVMNAYGVRLESLLSRPWKGPHGFSGRYSFESFCSLRSSTVLLKRGKRNDGNG